MSKYKFIENWTIPYEHWEDKYLTNGNYKECFLNRWMSIVSGSKKNLDPNPSYYLNDSTKVIELERKEFKEMLNLYNSKLGRKFFYKRLEKETESEYTDKELKEIDDNGWLS